MYKRQDAKQGSGLIMFFVKHSYKSHVFYVKKHDFLLSLHHNKGTIVW